VAPTPAATRFLDRRGSGEGPGAECRPARGEHQRRCDEQRAGAVACRPDSLLRDRRGEDGRESGHRRPLPPLSRAALREGTDCEGKGQRRRRVAQIETEADGVSERARCRAGCDEVPGPRRERHDPAMRTTRSRPAATQASGPTTATARTNCTMAATVRASTGTTRVSFADTAMPATETSTTGANLNSLTAPRNSRIPVRPGRGRRGR
jgi:hypothetical protein